MGIHSWLLLDFNQSWQVLARISKMYWNYERRSVRVWDCHLKPDL